MTLQVFDPRRAAHETPIERQAPELRLEFWRTVHDLRATIVAAREIHAQQRVVLESVRLQQLLLQQTFRRSRLEREKVLRFENGHSAATG